MTLDINDLRVSVHGKEILKGITIKVVPGEVHALMGPNGSGKSTLASSLMGHPKYTVTSGDVKMDGEDLLAMPVNERARKGLFLSFQYPVEIPGVTVESFLRMAYNAVSAGIAGTAGTIGAMSVVDFHKLLMAEMDSLKIDRAFARRYLNDGFSGGEKKRMEILQMCILKPSYIVLDETDSGLDVDALNVVAQGINRMRDGKRGILIITHFNRILKYVKPDHVHIIVDGKVIKSGDASLASEIEIRGYGHVTQ